MLTNTITSGLCEVLRDIIREETMLKVAYDLGKNPKTLQVELSPFQKTHKLGLFDVLDILFITQKPFPVLQYICNLYDYHAAPNAKGATTEDIHRLITKITQEHGSLSGVFLSVTNPDSEGGVEITKNEKSQMREVLLELKHLVNVLESNLKDE